MNLPLSKPALRQQLRKARDNFVHGLADGERARHEALAVERLLGVLGEGVWASYIAMGTEISPEGLMDHALPGQQIAFPWFASREAAMLFRMGGKGGFARGPFGIDQPEGNSAEVLPDWIVMPLVGADEAGNRIGQGAGHYDRALETLLQRKKVVLIGLAWEAQLVGHVPADPWDQPLDFIVTPDRTIATRP